MTAPHGFAPAMIPPNARPFEVMLAYLGVRETLPNRGPWVDETLRFVGLEPDPKLNPKVPKGGYAWCCAAFVWCAHKGGVLLPKTALVVRLWELVQQQGRQIAEPEMGCGAVHLENPKPDGTQHGHIMFGLHYDRRLKILETVSANTNTWGSRNGDRVGRVSHPRDHFDRNGGGFFHMRPGSSELVS